MYVVAPPHEDLPFATDDEKNDDDDAGPQPIENKILDDNAGPVLAESAVQGHEEEKEVEKHAGAVERKDHDENCTHDDTCEKKVDDQKCDVDNGANISNYAELDVDNGAKTSR